MTKFFTNAQLAAEIQRCEFCEDKPCKDNCPANCSPADFIMAINKTKDSVDYKRAANIIMSSNPLGGVCGAVCPEKHCMAKCVRKNFDYAINIPQIQAAIIAKAKELKYMPEFKHVQSNNKKIAVIGAGPAGLAASALLSQKGYVVTIFEKDKVAGGACNFIPEQRLDNEVLRTDIEFIKALGNIKFIFNAKDMTPARCLSEGFDAVIVSTGLDVPLNLNISGEEHTTIWSNFLINPKKYVSKDSVVAVIGGGAVAVDCATVAKQHGAKAVDLICLENNADMPLTAYERQELLQYDIGIISKTSVTAITQKTKENSLVLAASKINFPCGGTFKPELIVPNTGHTLLGYNTIIKAIGNKSSITKEQNDKIFYAGDIINGPTTVVEAVASGKNAACLVDAMFTKSKYSVSKNTKNNECLAGKVDIPVSLESDFFGRKILSPFLLSAAPSSDGYENMKKAYTAGWAGGVMKTAFDNVPIHIPAEYMFVYNDTTYANCDNVSGHSIDRVCCEIEKLVKEYPDRLTLASTGGPVTGNDTSDKKHWQANTLKLERAGAMGVEYSLSCPQGGDGTEGDIVSQNAKLTAKIVDWIMEVSDPQIPKLFKLTAAVTSIYPIITAIKEVLAKYPTKHAGVTLANSFPTLEFRRGAKRIWEEGIVAGMSGDGVKNISYLTLANVASLGITVSGNGGPMDYKAAANFLALGAKTVQFCNIVLKYGLHIIDHLHCGISYLMQDRGLKSIEELIGCALDKPVTGFMELNASKKISTVIPELCKHCGNCARCPYMAITYDDQRIPLIDPAKCIGCSLCTKKCFAEALYMRERTVQEQQMLIEE